MLLRISFVCLLLLLVHSVLHLMKCFHSLSVGTHGNSCCGVAAVFRNFVFFGFVFREVFIISGFRSHLVFPLSLSRNISFHQHISLGFSSIRSNLCLIDSRIGSRQIWKAFERSEFSFPVIFAISSKNTCSTLHFCSLA